MSEFESDLRDQAWRAIAPGFSPRAEVIAGLSELVEFDDDSTLTAQDVHRIVDELWTLRLDQLKSGPGDDARIAAAFAELEAAGIVSSMNLGFDQGEGSELSEELLTEDSRGYAFFHQQDAERLADSPADLFVGFDAVNPGLSRLEYDEAAARIGEEIREALTKRGLSVSWNGQSSTRIIVRNLDWRKPLPE